MACRQALRLDPKLANAHNGLARVLRNKGDLTGAEAAKGNVFRVLRGGCWRNEPKYGRSASRKNGEQNDAGMEVGFRLAAGVR